MKIPIINRKQVAEMAFKAFSVLLLSGLFIIVLNSDLRSNVRSLFRPQYRVILAVAMADLEGNGVKDQVIKVKTADGLFVEVYAPRPHKNFGVQQELIASAQLPDKKDGYFTFNGEVTNLAVDRVDREKSLKILASSFDGDLVGHLNVYRFVPGKKELERVSLN
jgi:hypothetical protein